MSLRTARVTLMATSLQFGAVAGAQEPDGRASIEPVQEALCVAAQEGRRGVWIWATGAGLKAAGGGLLWLQIQQPGLGGLRPASGLTFSAGMVLVHWGLLKALTRAGQGVQAQENLSAPPDVDRLSVAWWYYGGSLMMPLIRPVAVYLGSEQLTDLEDACTRYRR